MEKIYMEENNNRKGKKSVIDTSVVLSFVVAIFAIFSIAMAGLSMNQKTGVSYAAPVEGNAFNLKMGKKVFAYNNPTAMTKAYIMETYYYDSVNINRPIYCIERAKNVVNDTTYTKTDTARSGSADIRNDKVLLYLLGIGSNTSSLKAVTNYEDDVDMWVVQSAIWYYLNETYGNAADVTNVYNLVLDDYLDDKAIIEKDGSIYLSLVDDVNALAPGSFQEYEGLTGPNGKIIKLVNEAKANKDVVPKVIATKASDEIAKTDDGKYYQSALITVSGNLSSAFSGFDIMLSGIDGAIVVDENGQTMSQLYLAPGTKFYVRIPADKVTKEVQKLNVGITGYFNLKDIAYYAPSNADLQRMASVGNLPVAGGTEVEFVGTDDTGMNTAQTIYFIGLIVLLCGIGIVYANAKPAQVKQ